MARSSGACCRTPVEFRPLRPRGVPPGPKGRRTRIAFQIRSPLAWYRTGLSDVRSGDDHKMLWLELVPHTGFEPVISALRGRCPGPLDECGLKAARTAPNRADDTSRSRHPATAALQAVGVQEGADRVRDLNVTVLSE